MNKVCTQCWEEKPEEEFYLERGTHRKAACKECEKARVRRYHAERPGLSSERSRRFREKNPRYDRERLLVKHYNITIEQYDLLLEKQNGVCAICFQECKSGRELAVDHDHSCCAGKTSCGDCVRGLLCTKCNTAIGLLDYSVNRMQSAITYVTNYIVKGTFK